MALPIKAQWYKTLTGQSALIDRISVVNDSIIWIKDENGDKFSVTLNGGRTWTTKNFPVGISTPGMTSCLSAVSEKVAFVLLGIDMPTNHRGIYKTTDGGDTWTRQTTAFNSPVSGPDQVYFWNENEGFSIGDGISTATGPFEMYTTTNGGIQWDPVPLSKMPLTGSIEYSINTQGYIRVYGNTVYILSYSGEIYKSVNKGYNWSMINTPTNGHYASFDFKDDNNGLITSRDDNTKVYSGYVTSDGGVNWTLKYTTLLISSIKYIPSAGNYFIAKTPGLIYTTDGELFIEHPSFTNIDLYAIDYTPSWKIFIGGVGTMYSSSNFQGNLDTAVSSVFKNDAIIVGYRIYSLSGKLLITEDSPVGIKLQNIRQNMNKGVYLIYARLNDGQYQHFKFIVQ